MTGGVDLELISTHGLAITQNEEGEKGRIARSSKPSRRVWAGNGPLGAPLIVTLSMVSTPLAEIMNFNGFGITRSAEAQYSTRKS